MVMPYSVAAFVSNSPMFLVAPFSSDSIAAKSMMRAASCGLMPALIASARTSARRMRSCAAMVACASRVWYSARRFSSSCSLESLASSAAFCAASNSARRAFAALRSFRYFAASSAYFFASGLATADSAAGAGGVLFVAGAAGVCGVWMVVGTLGSLVPVPCWGCETGSAAGVPPAFGTDMRGLLLVWRCSLHRHVLDGRRHVLLHLPIEADKRLCRLLLVSGWQLEDRKSTRLNSS